MRLINNFPSLFQRGSMNFNAKYNKNCTETIGNLSLVNKNKFFFSSPS